MKMSFANANVDTTIRVFKNMALDFGGGEIMVQIQILARANFDLLLGWPFHCLMSTTTDDFLDRSQSVILLDPNSRKQFIMPT